MIIKIEELIEDVINQIRDFTDVAVIGISGGADSTLIAILCILALGKENVIGVTMPCDIIVDANSTSKAQELGDKLDIKIEKVNLDSVLHKMISASNIYRINNKLLIGNIKARLRMITLYSIVENINFQNSYIKKARVIGTDNYSENFLGYFTKYGDGGVDINPIEDLYKSEVYQLLEYFRDKGIIEEGHINRIPSAELWENQTDENELGMTYNDIEKSIRKYPIIEDDLDKKILDIHKNTQHKREIPNKFELRKYCD